MTREVRVVPQAEGDLAEGHRIEGITVTPSTVQISGPQSLVRGYTEVPTDLVDLSGLTEDKQIEVLLAIKDRTVRASTGAPVHVKVDIEPLVGKRLFEAVPVLVRVADWQASPETASVTFEGPVVDLNALEAEQISVQVHLPEPVPAEGVVAILGAEQGPRLEVVHQGAVELVVHSILPDRIDVEPTLQ
jgi:YbbR domain-containing protein